MNFYDKLHETIKEFKQMPEFTEYIRLKEVIKRNEKYCEMLKEFKQKQQAHQMEFINTGKLSDEAQKELENLYSLLIQNNDVRKFLEYEMKLDIYLADMQKIIGEGIKDLLEF